MLDERRYCFLFIVEGSIQTISPCRTENFTSRMLAVVDKEKIGQCICVAGTALLEFLPSKRIDHFFKSASTVFGVSASEYIPITSEIDEWMDRHLGATVNTYSTTSAMEASRAYGMLYQWGRKDPLPGSLGGTASEIGVLFDGYGVSKQLRKESSNTLDYTMQNPDAFCKSLYLDGASWEVVMEF